MNRVFLTILMALTLVGCATTARYMPYTDQRMSPKSKDYFIAVYPVSQKMPTSQPYTVIGRVEIQGYASDGVNPSMLNEQARNIARKKGADAVINAGTQVIPYGGIAPGYFGYYPYSNTFLKFTGDLIIFMPAPVVNQTS